MLKRFFLAMFAGAVLLAVGSGCVIIKEYAPEANAVKINPVEQELARKLLQAFIKDDAKTFVSLLPEEARKNFTTDNFKQTRKSVIESVGEPISYTYMTTLELSSLHPQIWKVRFKRHNVNRTKEFTSEVLFKVITGMSDRKTAVITGFHFL